MSGGFRGHAGWREVWRSKGFAASPLQTEDGGESLLQHLMVLSGYDSAASTMQTNAVRDQAEYIKTELGIAPTDTVYEVGCGAGTLLYVLQHSVNAVGGADFAEPLIDIAKSVLASNDLTVHEAVHVPKTPRYDVVISNGVFIYFPSEQYAREALDIMVSKARRAVGILDVNDRTTKREYLLARAAQPDTGRKSSAGLDQLFLDPAFFLDAAADHGLTCRIQSAICNDSVNGKYRFNVFLTRH